MKHFLFCIFIAAIIFTVSCSHFDASQFRKYPSLKEVVKEFEERYELYTNDSSYMTMVKKPTGWCIDKISRRTGMPLSEKIFWSLKENGYIHILKNYFKDEFSTAKTEHFDISDPGKIKEYSLMIYFGYNEWADDVIHALEGHEISDTLKECLGRAYQEKCIGVARPGQRYNFHLQDRKMTEEEGKKFCDYADKEIALYKEILEHDSLYETPFGKIKTKLGNTYMFAWAELIAGGQTDRAGQYLVKGLYEKEMISYAENTLNSAEKNAIIFSRVDDRTFPLWYAQQVLGVRKDVAVIQIDRFDIPNFLFDWKQRYHFDLGMNGKFYSDSLTDFLYVNANEAERTMGIDTVAVSFADIRDAYEKKDVNYFIKDAGDKKIFKIPFNNFRLTFNAFDDSCTKFSIRYDYFTKSQMAVFDIIASNYPQRPIYFQHADADFYYKPFTGAMREEGILIRFNPSDTDSHNANGLRQNLAAFRKNMEQYSFPVNDVQHLQLNQAYIDYIVIWNNFMLSNFIAGDTVEAKKIIDQYVIKMKLSEFDGPLPYLIAGTDYLFVGEKGRAREFLTRGLSKMKSWHRDHKHEDELVFHIDAMNYVTNSCKQYGLDDLQQEFADEKEALEKMNE